MVLYLCLIPNRGARIGHQTDDYFKLVAYCKKNNFIFVYHPFIANSATFEEVLRFKLLHNHHYNEIKNTMKTINISNLNDTSKSIHEQLIDLNNSTENVLLFDHICGNEEFYKNYNITNNDIIEIKKSHRNVLLNNYINYVQNDYICIHIRCGDIIKDPSRYLDVNYFIEQYKKIQNTTLPVYIVTEQNFKGDDILYKNIKNCNIIKTDEITSFYYLVNCKYLVASRSGFSNLAYILGNMQVIKPPNDWNCYWDNLIE
jgi:hypothetical protein